ncbi:cell death abnormality protein 1 isoform X2 [Zeugodacus cucurbitae]|uniref:Multiple epidermal growth factor-like domains protein 10 n=1 Tax=Zeugodacus cucurbitae TaxID=28588 RepID=A0A0A1WMH3_ZEUCU|nr:cell death abnormality protein 1 isoform X2 [Zeugodacus cucurbitae]
MFKLIECIVRIFLCALIVLRPGLAMIPEDIMDYSCTDDEHCQYYVAESIISACFKGICHCYNNQTKMDVICEPNILRTNNIIGGHCPCNLPHAECHQSDHLCYCEENYVPTKDKRRCILREVSLGGPCETDEQCLFSTIFSHCDEVTKNCSCNVDFYAKNSTCLSQTKLRSKCNDKMDCGPHKTCLPDIGECVCEPSYVSANTSEDCLPGRKLHEDCVDTTQCYAIMGPGAACENGKCRCREEYVIVTKKGTGHSYSVAMGSVCKPLAQIGQYCSLHEHCHNEDENENEQLMECDHGECVCRFGIKNKSPCSLSTAATVNINKTLLWLILAMAGLQMYTLRWEKHV